jgi:hypothetical protein
LPQVWERNDVGAEFFSKVKEVEDFSDKFAMKIRVLEVWS